MMDNLYENIKICQVVKVLSLYIKKYQIGGSSDKRRILLLRQK
jgi:hypothetical protein